MGKFSFDNVNSMYFDVLKELGNIGAGNATTAIATMLNLTIVIISKGEKQVGLVVDDLMGQQEIVIKSLGSFIDNSTKIISGATILGDGEVALILDVNTLM